MATLTFLPKNNTNDQQQSASSSPLVIQFAHGLESGPHGRKYQVLRRQWKYRVVAPDMRPLIQQARQRVIRRFVVMTTLVVAIIVILTLWGGQSWWNTRRRHGAITLGATIALLLAIGAWSVITTTRILVQQCVDLQWQCLQQHQPDVVIGSSFGGAIVAFMLASAFMSSTTSSRSSQQPPAILLLAPAHVRLNWLTWYGTKHSYNTTTATTTRIPSMLIVHGAHDTVVPLRDNEQWVQALLLQRRRPHEAAIRLVIVPDSHALRNTFATLGQEWIAQALALRNGDDHDNSPRGNYHQAAR